MCWTLHKELSLTGLEMGVWKSLALKMLLHYSWNFLISVKIYTIYFWVFNALFFHGLNQGMEWKDREFCVVATCELHISLE